MNIVKDYKNTKIELSILDERETYLRELLQEVQKRKNIVKDNCSHPLFVYFGRSYYNFESRNTHIAKCICCGKSKIFKDSNSKLEKFKKSKKVLDLTEFINHAENFLIPNSTWYEETFNKVKALVDNYIFSKEEIDTLELKIFVKEQFDKENKDSIKELKKILERENIYD